MEAKDELRRIMKGGISDCENCFIIWRIRKTALAAIK
jgi:hypothetical protein